MDKARIMNHMNKDHALNLSDYLQHYCQVPAAAIRRAAMVDLTDDGMTVVADDSPETLSSQQRHFVPFEPRLQNLKDIRPRVIEMAHTAAKALRPDEPLPTSKAHH